MRWAESRTLAKVTVLAVLAAAIAQLIGVAVLSELNAFALVLDLLLVGLAALAASGRWKALALTAGMSGLLAVVTASGLAAGSREPSEVVAAVIFLLLTLTAVVTGTAATVQSYRDDRMGLVSKESHHSHDTRPTDAPVTDPRRFPWSGKSDRMRPNSE